MAVRAYESIPGPKEPPIIGSVLKRFSGPLQFFREMQETCGDAARFTLFREKFILFSDPALVDEVLITKNKLFRKGRALEGARVFLGNSLLVSEGEEHTRQRRLIQPAFHKARIAGYADVMADRARQWTEAQQAGAEIDVAVEMNRLTLAVVAATLFGSDVDREAQDIAESLTVIIESFNQMLLPLWRYWRNLPLPQYLRLAAARRTLDKTILRPERLPTLDDPQVMPFTTAVLSEAMRLYPPVWVVGRRALEDVTIGEYEVPRRTIVIMSQYIIHHDSRWWPNAAEFRPERWLDEAAMAARPKFAYFPFGGGARKCIGDMFAWAEGVILLAVMARRWKFEPVPGHPVELNPTVTLRPKHGLKMIVREA